MLRILYLEPFEGGSHAAFTKTLTTGVEAEWTKLTLPGRHWKWRMRGAVPYWALEHADTLAAGYDLVFASSYVPLAELLGLAPALARTPRILYFHENQLTFPARTGAHAERDHHFGVSQLVSGLAATRLLFNSTHNRDGFLGAGRALLRRLPDAVPGDWIDRLERRSEVLGVPLDLPDLPEATFEAPAPTEAGPLVLWNHRWEHDKGPEVFVEALRALAQDGLPFRVAVCGRRFSQVPAAFEALPEVLGDRLLAFGDTPDRAAYEGWLRRADIAVSTARHEFFGIAMLEATHFGAYPLVPDALAYPELFPSEHRYPQGDFQSALRARVEAHLAGRPLRADRRALTRPHGAPRLADYATRLAAVASLGGSNEPDLA